MQRYIRDPLPKIAAQVASGERPQYPVREILSWYHYRVRNRYAVEIINRDLASLELGTIPHFDWTFLDGIVTFVPRAEAIRVAPLAYPDELTQVNEAASLQTSSPGRDDSHNADLVAQQGVSPPQPAPDPTYRIGRLEMANRRPVSVAPDSTIREAITIMLKHDYSQLPVMTGERSVKGLFSWKSYGSRRSQGHDCAYVREAMGECRKVGMNESIFQVVAAMQDHDCVVVEDGTGAITGIITPYDISVTFGQLGEPFLILAEIENHIRGLIEGRFTNEELAVARDPLDTNRMIESVSDLTFGEYVRLLESADRWDRLGLALDRTTFVKDLEEVRRIRNDVMHFDPEGIDESDLKMLRTFVNFLQRIQRLRAKA